MGSKTIPHHRQHQRRRVLGVVQQRQGRDLGRGSTDAVTRYYYLGGQRVAMRDADDNSVSRGPAVC